MRKLFVAEHPTLLAWSSYKSKRKFSQKRYISPYNIQRAEGGKLLDRVTEEEKQIALDSLSCG
jgi:hypothetical protein